MEIGRASRSKGKQCKERLKQAYEKLLSATGRVVAQAKRFAEEVASGVKRSADVLKQAALEGLRKELETMIPRVEQVIHQTRARVFYSRRQAREWVERHGLRVTDLRVAHIFPYKVEDYVQHRYIVVCRFRYLPARVFHWLEKLFGWHL